MSKYFISILAFCSPLYISAQTTEKNFSLEEVLIMARERNLSLVIAREGITTANAERQELNSLWYPTLAVTGEYAHSFTEIAAVTTVGKIGNELLDNIAPALSGNPVIEDVLNGIGKSQLRIPIMPRNTAEVGAELAWVVFSGGRRIAASRIADRVLSVANEQYNATENGVILAVAEAYWRLALARQLTDVRRSALALHSEHLRQARRLEEEGMINHAERLVAEVACKQSTTLLASAESEQIVAVKALATLLVTDSLTIIPTTALSVPHTIPAKEDFFALISEAPTINMLKSGEEIASLTLRAERSRYLPTISFIGHQKLWSSGLDKNIFPRTIVGVGLSWTLFDGLSREGAVARSKSSLRTAETSRQKTLQELYTTIDKCYAILTTSLSEYEAQQTTLALAEELHRTQLRAFAEGMATSTDVVDATQRLSEVQLAQIETLYTIDTSLATLLTLVGRADSLTTYFTPRKL